MSIGGDSLSFYWEFCGGECVVAVNVPTPEEWASTPRYARFERREFLTALARELAAMRCKGCKFEIATHHLNMLEPSSERGEVT